MTCVSYYGGVSILDVFWHLFPVNTIINASFVLLNLTWTPDLANPQSAAFKAIADPFCQYVSTIYIYLLPVTFERFVNNYIKFFSNFVSIYIYRYFDIKLLFYSSTLIKSRFVLYICFTIIKVIPTEVKMSFNIRSLCIELHDLVTIDWYLFCFSWQTCT